MKKQTQPTHEKLHRMVTDAMCVALFVLFAVVLTVKTPLFEISLASLPVLLAARLFRGRDALVVAFLGSFTEQLLSPYGLSLTTPLWMAPPVLQAATAALGFFLAGRAKKPWLVFLVILAAEVVLTAANTAALYADGAIMGYPVKALHLLLPTRLANGGVRTVISCLLIPPLAHILEKRT